jgi:hypothetical protein
MQSGELIVTGKDKATILLNGIPSEVRVHFKHELELTPCNPHHSDTLEYEVKASNILLNEFVLLITWDVTGVREIVWKVSY